MKTSDLISMCIRNLLRRKFRTFLTVTGVIIGTCAIVVMISIGVGMSESMNAWLNSMGDLSVIEVYSQGSGKDALLNDAAITAMQAIPGVDIATPLFQYQPEQGQLSIFAGKKERYSTYSNIIGVYPEALEKLGYKVGEGAELSASGKKIIPILFGSRMAYNFQDVKSGKMIDGWEDENGNLPDPFFKALDTPISIKLSNFDLESKSLKYEASVVGILESGSNDYQVMYSMYMHIDDLKRIQEDYNKLMGIKKDKNKKEQYDNVRVKALTLDGVADVEKAISEMGFGTWSMESMREDMQSRAKQTQLILGLLGCVSLFVAAISITNTMVMSVYERTREIGVMKVLGCVLSDIRAVFLIEAGLIGTIGGILGIIISYILSFLLNTFGGALGNMLGGMGMDGSKISVIPMWLAVLGLTFATLIGIVSGFQPANRAVKISALEAIKSE